MQTVGLITPAGPTAYLTCLAYLGSYLERLRVLDRAYDTQVERLRGRKRPERQSGSLGVELPDGRKVRLTEVANADRLSAAELRLMFRALDGVVIVEAPGQTAVELKRRIAALAETSPRIGSLVIDEGADLDDPGAVLPLEAIRRAFVEDLSGDLDWPALFDRMWRPLGELLEPSGGRGAESA